MEETSGKDNGSKYLNYVARHVVAVKLQQQESSGIQKVENGKTLKQLENGVGGGRLSTINFCSALEQNT